MAKKKPTLTERVEELERIVQDLQRDTRKRNRPSATPKKSVPIIGGRLNGR